MKDDTKTILGFIAMFAGLLLAAVILIAAVIGFPTWAIIEIIKAIKA